MGVSRNPRCCRCAPPLLVVPHAADGRSTGQSSAASPTACAQYARASPAPYARISSSHLRGRGGGSMTCGLAAPRPAQRPPVVRKVVQHLTHHNECVLILGTAAATAAAACCCVCCVCCLPRGCICCVVLAHLQGAGKRWRWPRSEGTVQNTAGQAFLLGMQCYGQHKWLSRARSSSSAHWHTAVPSCRCAASLSHAPREPPLCCKSTPRRQPRELWGAP